MYNTDMRKFKFNFTKLTTAFIYLGLVLSLAAFVSNTVFVFTEGLGDYASPVYPVIRYVLMYVVSVALFIILTSLLFSSYYAVTEKHLITCFGVIKSKYDVKKIQTIILDRKTNKLTVYFDENNFVMIVVNEAWYEDFVDAVIKVNPRIEFSIRSKENEHDEKNEQK